LWRIGGGVMVGLPSRAEWAGAVTTTGADMAVNARNYSSPTLVLLAYDWADGRQRADFHGATPGSREHR
jgi:hypothetical protein